jgi:phage repressor protein C with HTH and peptisase S24 domain
MRLKHEGLELMIASGDSMSPTLDDGDIIFVDTRATLIENNAVYLFKCNDSFLIRRVQLTPEDSVDLVCDNKKIANTIVPRSAIRSEQIESGFGARESDLFVIGKVKWAIKRAVTREKLTQID